MIHPIRSVHLTLTLACLILAGCATAPARLKQVTKDDESELHGLLADALQPAQGPAAKFALGRFVERWKQECMGAEGTLTPCGGSGLTYHVTFEGESCAYQTLAYYDEIHPAAEFKIEKLPDHQRPGVGTPLLAIRENRHQEAIETYYPPEVITRALTVVAHPGRVRGATQDVRLSLLCPMSNDDVVVNGKRQPLAADFSVPWAAALARAGKLNQSKVFDMLTRTPSRKTQLYLMEPYDPKKEPLIMIHGIMSTPLAWAGLSNELWADETVRHRYQIWHYLYNTSAPALYSTRLLRGQLKELRAKLDPEGDDPAMQRTTLLTHSMGGLVGKALAMEPGDTFWKATFNVPHEQLKMSPEDRAMLNDAFEWKADPTIHRIIFVATPHRGSDVADGIIGRIGTWITKPPSQFQDFYARLSKDNPGVFTPDYDALGRGKLNSVNSLSTKQPTLRILAELPFAHKVCVHCILGDRGRPGPVAESSDGLVKYSSSHLEGVDSELVVPAGHGCYGHPLALAEIKRVLKL